MCVELAVHTGPQHPVVSNGWIPLFTTPAAATNALPTPPVGLTVPWLGRSFLIAWMRCNDVVGIEELDEDAYFGGARPSFMSH